MDLEPLTSFKPMAAGLKNLGESGGIYHDIYIITIILYIYTIHIYIYIYNICLYIHTPSGYLTVRHGKIHHAINR